eukprot:TRINITY_DN707_c0_g1_i7.p1 TRINITY_DN707_c0_g1~~TRINITY_DN707_c0_g1_i7.p1  ORF type:complete len:969 (+),score=194.19 TRINITY_DN707_c0_g1_i7:54-2909(+)
MGADDGKPDKAEKAAVRVMVRVRPFARRELGDNPHEYPVSVVSMNEGGKVDVLDQQGALQDQFEFHETFWSIPEEQKQYSSAPFATQETVFNKTGTIAVEAALKGYHTCIFAYGQTGSGKTHTMLGSLSDPGVAPRLVDYLFDSVEQVRSKKRQWEYNIDVSFMEIYNEKVKDLLTDKIAVPAVSKMTRKGSKAAIGKRKTSVKAGSSTPSKRKSSVGFNMGRNSVHGEDDQEFKELRVRSSPATGIYVEGLTRLGKDKGLSTADDVKSVMRSGMEYRSTAATAMNDTSSRSHAIFQICLTAKNPVLGTQRYAHINLVDLAGSERIKMSKAEGQTLTEATKINLSLSTLRRVIDILIENSQRKKNQPKQIAPYRDSTLTWILSESLGGNSKTMMIATVSPAESNKEDTLNTLRYALKAKAIVNTVKVNEAKSTVMLSAMQREMENLRNKLNDPTVSKSEAEIEEMRSQQLHLEDEYQTNLKSIDDATEKIKEWEDALVLKEEIVQSVKTEVKNLRAENLEEKHMVAEEEHKAARSQMDRKKSILKEVHVEVEQTTGVLTEEKQHTEHQKSQVAVADVALKFESHERVYKGRGFFRDAFRQAFSIRKSALTKDQTLQSLKTVSSMSSKMSIEIELTAQETRDLELLNIRLGQHMARTERDVNSTEKRRASEEHDTKQQCTILEEELEVLKSEVGVLERAAKKLSFQTREKQREKDIKTGLRIQSIQKRVAEQRSVKKDRRAKYTDVRETREVLKQLKGDIEDENAYSTRRLQDEKVLLAETAQEIEDFKRQNISLRQELLYCDSATAELQTDITVMTSKNYELREEREQMTEEHEELKKFASEKFFPKNGQTTVGAPGWADSEINEESLAQVDANRSWVNSGCRYKRHTSPTRGHNTSPGDATSSRHSEFGYRRVDTHTTTHSVPRSSGFSRYDTAPNHPSPAPHPILSSPG